ncbi:MAG: cation-translocating P-type ATPase [Anaerolineae bacterium]|nr:cation-translocating P-type ATPase [Anaerolineae bacterium]
MKMKQFRTWIEQPAQRRKIITLVSGSLIALSLILGELFGQTGLRHILMIIAALNAGSDIAWRAWQALRNRHISIELLVTIATVGALLIGEYWEAAAVTFLFMLGAYLEARTLNQTRQALQDLLDLAPVNAIVLRDGQQIEVLAHEVKQSELVLVKPGAKVPVDGEVVGGYGAIDESAITGESIPMEKTTGDNVFAGTINQDGLLQVKALGIGADTTLARIIRRVEEAQEEKAPTQRFIEWFGSWYTPAIIVLSAVAWILSRDIHLALTLLVIGCPGALVISTPVSIVAGIGQAAKRGILIKGGEYLENAGKISALALDKTGTITQGRPQLTDIIALIPAMAGPAEKSQVSGADTAITSRWTAAQQDVLYWAAIAESGSGHPLARPIMAEASALRETPIADDFVNHTGRGIQVSYQGHDIRVGSRDLMQSAGIEAHPDTNNHFERLSRDGKTAVIVAVDGIELGILGIADPPRSTATVMLDRLKANGIDRVVMLTGDAHRTAHAVANTVGISEVRAGLLPEDKLEHIRQLQREGYVVAMVGDGINDAPALATANIGIAMGAAGTDVAIETADIALMADDLLKIPEAIGLSKATLRNIRQNVLIALLTVTGLLIGVLLGKVHMAGGMFIHELSVLVVVFNGMRLLRINPAPR